MSNKNLDLWDNQTTNKDTSATLLSLKRGKIRSSQHTEIIIDVLRKAHPKQITKLELLKTSKIRKKTFLKILG